MMNTERAAELAFRCCDTTWNVIANGPHAETAVEAARSRALELEAVLNAFDPASAVSRLNRAGRVRNAHVARLVARAEEYSRLTRGAFDIAHGRFEHDLKDYLRGRVDAVPVWGRRASFRVCGDDVETDGMLDLNGIAKGYIVDQARLALSQAGADGFVDGGGDMATPTEPIDVDSPYDDGIVATLDTRWNVATSGRKRRRRGPVDHLYDPREQRAGARHDQVTVLARRDCVEADVLATTLAILPLEEGHRLANAWPGVEALWIRDGNMWATRGFKGHVASA